MFTPAQADRNLLAGVLALQMDFVTGDQLLAAMNAWALRKDTPLLDLLHQDGVLAGEDREALVHLVERHVARHGDARKSLASLHLDSDARRELEQIKNTDVQDGLDSMRTTVSTPRFSCMPPSRCTRSSTVGPPGSDAKCSVMNVFSAAALPELSALTKSVSSFASATGAGLPPGRRATSSLPPSGSGRSSTCPSARRIAGAFDNAFVEAMMISVRRSGKRS